MINDVRNLVNFILNKESRGYITPLQFNTFSKQAQQEILDGYFIDYNKTIVGSNSRAVYKELHSKASENISRFVTEPTNLTFLDGYFTSPGDLYKTITLLYNNTEAEEIQRDKVSYILSNPLVYPSVFYPLYVRYGEKYKVYPESIDTNVQLIYARNPKDPNWTYELIGNEPIFNQSAPGFQDFEIGNDDKFKLISKILKYCGLNLREPDIVGASIAFENQDQVT